MFLTRNEQLIKGGGVGPAKRNRGNVQLLSATKNIRLFTINSVLSEAITSLVFKENGFNASRLHGLPTPVPPVASPSHSLRPLGVRGGSGSNSPLFFRDSFD